MPKSDLERLRTRWRRWLGNKTRLDKPYWTTLLDSNWSGWADAVLAKHNDESARPHWRGATPVTIRRFFGRAIDLAESHDLMELDEMYCDDKLDRGTK